jgi:hypothetical protein
MVMAMAMGNSPMKEEEKLSDRVPEMEMEMVM